MTKPPSFRDLLGLGETSTSGRSLHIDNSLMEFRVTGYSPVEVGELLAAFRNHAHLMMDLAQNLTSAADAVRYMPEREDADPTSEERP